MAKKPLPSASWTCPHNCKPSPTPCEHLERMLPKLKPEKAQLRGMLVDQVAAEPIQVVEKDVVAEMRRLGFKPYEIELIEKRVLDGYTLADLVKDGWTSKMTVRWHTDLTLAKLRKLWPKK